MTEARIEKFLSGMADIVKVVHDAHRDDVDRVLDCIRNDIEHGYDAKTILNKIKRGYYKSSLKAKN